eukprot:scaffold37928_cov74-Phaeocystis_antarctica.AAC.3
MLSARGVTTNANFSRRPLGISPIDVSSEARCCAAPGAALPPGAAPEAALSWRSRAARRARPI